MVRGAVVAIAAAGLLAACGGDDPPDALTVDGAWARATPAVVTVGAVYLRVTSPLDDALVGATVEPSVAAAMQLHSTEMADDMATMTEQVSLAIPAGGELVLDPLGDHLMLVGLADPLTAGETFDVTLKFATAADTTVEVEVRDRAP